jgi:hypothetical protein
MYIKISDLLGSTLKSAVVSPDKSELVFTLTDGTKYRMFHDQDCCEHVWLEEVIGDLEDLVGSPLLEASERSEDHSGEHGDDSATWTFYHLGTIKGTVVLRWCGESNGYYSESVEIEKIGANRHPHDSFLN